MKKNQLRHIFIVTILAALACCAEGPDEVNISGNTMGTTYSVKFVLEPEQETDTENLAD